MKKGIASLLATCGAVLVITMLATPVNATQRLRDVRVVDEGVTRLYHTMTTNVGDLLQERGYTLSLGDHVNMAMDERFTDNQIPRIEITRGMEVEVTVDGVWQMYRVSSTSRVGHIVTLVEAEHGEVYSHNLRRSDPIPRGEVLEFFRPTSHTFTSSIPIPYEVTHNYDPTLTFGEERVVQEGEPGEAELVSEIIMLAGMRIDSRLLSEIVLSEPIDQVVAIGTRQPTPTRPRFEIPTAYGEFSYIRRIEMNASAYTSGFSCTGKRPGDPGYGITASGMRVQHGVVAVDPSVIPLGTPLFVEGYGFAVAADTGSAIRGNSIDLFMYDLQDARNFGRRTVVVYVLE
ncbi:MAG: 3D domain-containing protein [Defluviitaleaceae bacterium]|nr:3D domain-containing protein [Defluviitaleaceae bacterium]